MNGIRKSSLWAAVAVLAVMASIAPPASAQEATSLATADASDLLGSWGLTMDFQGRSVPLTLTVVDLEGRIGASIELPRRPDPVIVNEITKTENGYTLSYPVEFGGNKLNLTMEIAIEDGKVSGTISDDSGFFNSTVEGGPAEAEAKEPFQFTAKDATKLDTADAQEFIGSWDIEMDMRGRKQTLTVQLVDVEGKVGGLIKAPFSPDPQIITAMEMREEGLRMSFEASFGDNTFQINIDAVLDGDTIKGKFGDSGGFFSAEFEGTRGDTDLLTARASDEDRGRRGRGRRRGGGGQARIMLNDNEIKIRFGALKADSDDYKAIASMKEGAVIRYVGGRAMKLLTDGNLRFGNTTVKAGNAHESYPGVYSLWLKKTSDGWRLVFNEDADIWGTQHDPRADVAEIPLKLTELSEQEATFKVELKEEGETGGHLRVAWGTYEWTADFDLVQ